MRHSAWQSGSKPWAWILVALALMLASVAYAADVTSQFAITRSGFVLNRLTNTFDQTVTLRNASTGPVSPPVIVVVNGLPSTVALANKAGQTGDGAPYVSPALPGGVLAAGASVSFPLKFANPQRVGITSTLQVLNTIDLPLDAPSLIRAIATDASTAFLVGRVVGASNLPLTLQATSSRTCVAGSLVSGAPAGVPVAVTTDAAGYFGVSVSGVAAGAFVAVNVASPTVTATSACLVSSRDNDSWPKAFPLDGSSATASDLIDTPGKARWYKFDVIPGQRIEVRLTGLAADYDIAVFKDIGQAFAKQFNPASASTTDLLKLTAEYAPSVFSPSVFSPSVFSPDAFSPSVFSPSVFSPSVFSPSVFSPSVFSPSVFSPSVFSPSVFSPSVFSPSVFSPSVFSPSVFSSQELAQAFSTAQTRSVISVAATPGTAGETTVVNTWNNTGSFYVRVGGHNGAFDTAVPFTVSVVKGTTTCVGVTDMAVTKRTPVAAAGLRTVILADSSKTPLDAPLNVAGGGSLRDKLAAFAKRAEIAGVVVDVAGDARVRALKAQAASSAACPFAKNLVAQEIKGIVDSYRANPLRYVVLVGNDDAIPFFRSPDESAIGLESGYVPPVESNSPSEASLRLDYVLSQDGYGSTTSLSLSSSDFAVPALAVGRLVESTNEIAGLLDAYVAANGVVAPRSSLVTGYDFLADAASAVRDQLQQATGALPDALITPNGKSPQDPASWTAAQLSQQLFGGRHDVIFLAGHFSANSALAADFTTSVLTTDLAASTVDFTNSIVFSAGCHSGYNLVDGDAITGVTQPLDWAQAFARKGATLIAGTGYQYGDTDFLEYSERIYANFARELRAGTGAVAVGDALVRAKLAYLAVTPDIRGLHQKALLESALFGLPMLGVDMPAGRQSAPATGPIIAASAITSGPALSLGLKSFDLVLSPSVTSNTVTLKNTQGGADVVATWLSGPDGVVTKPGEPALPLVAMNVTPTDAKTVLRGVGFRGGSFTDSSPMLPFSGAPTTELRGIHVPFLSPTFYPARMWTPNYFGALAGSGGTQLLVTPVQHRVANVADKTSTQRRYGSLALRLFYSGNLTQAALSDAPTIVAVGAAPDGSGVAFSAQVVGDPAAGIQQVWVTYTSDGANAWTSLDLAQCVAPLPAECGGVEDSRAWRGRLATLPANLKYIVQAASGVGLVSLEDNRGAYFGVVTGPPAPTVFALSSPPTTATVGETLSITGTLTAGGAPVAGKLVTIAVGGTTQVGVTDSSGNVTVQVSASALTGNFQITAAFAGDEGVQQSSTSAALSVDKAATNLASLAPVGATLSGVLAGKGQPLAQESVGFAVDGPGGSRTIFAITDYLGQATLPPPGLPAGTYTVSQASYGGNETYAATSVALSQQFIVAKTPQSIAFAALANKTLGDPDFAVFASASSTLPVAFTASGACTAAGNTVHLTTTGSCTITATQPGDANYDPAAPVARMFTVATNGKADQVIVFGAAPANVAVGNPPVTVTATSTSPTAPPSTIPILFSSLTTPVCTTGGTNGATVTPVAAGSCTIAANQAGDATYNPALQVTQTFTVAPAGATAHFSATGSMLAARSDHTATLLQDGRVLVAGGFNATGAPLNSSELYCPDNAQAPPSFTVCPAGQRGTFAAAPALPVAAAGHTATRLHDGTVLLIGGTNTNLQWFTPATQSWTSATSALADRTFHTATLLANGNVFVAGGVDANGQTLSTTFVVDTSTVPWTIASGPNLAFAREGHTATLLPDGTVLIAGGRRSLPVNFAVVGEYELYDPSVAGPFGNGVVVDEAAMSRARFWHAAEIAGLRVVVAGGSCDPLESVSSALSSTEFFSFDTGAEPAVPCNGPAGSSDLQQARRAFTMTPLPDGSLLAIGGADGGGASRSTSEIFAAAGTTFALGPSLASARAEHQATSLLDGRVLVTGGIGEAGTPLTSAELFSGGGGAGGASNQPPIANAGPDQSVAVGATVQLSSGGSGDPEGRTVRFFWSITARPAASAAQLSNANVPNPTFVADVAGVYLVRLVVNDGGVPPLDSAPDSVQITAATGNRAPVANGDSYSVAQDTTLVVDAASGVLANDTDADGDPLTAAIVNVPAHGVATLNANGGFSYAPAAGYSGPDSFTYQANDGKTTSNVVTVSLTVTPVAPINHPPVASAGADQGALVGQAVQLGGTCTDVDAGDTPTPAWSFTSKPAGSNASLSSTSILNPTFTPDVTGGYVLRLVCNDGKVDSAASTTTVTVTTGTISVGAATVQPGGSAALPIGINPAAPPGGLVVTLSITDASIATLASSTVTIPAGQTTGSGTVNGILVGSTTVSAQAPGYAPTQSTVTVAGAPFVFTVTNGADSGAGSLRDAINRANAAPGPNAIAFAANVTGTITLTSGQMRIDGPLTIVGPGAGVLTIDGNLNDRIFTIVENNAPACPALTGPSDFPVTISGLTLARGSRNVADSGGGAIQSSKSLMLDSIVVRNSQAKGGGGLVFNAQYPGQTLTITNSQFVDNVAKPVVTGNTGAHNGGALLAHDNCPDTPTTATITIVGSTFTGNRVQPVDLEGRAGAIAAFLPAATVAIVDSVIVDNHVEPPASPIAGFDYPGGGGHINAKIATVQRTEIAGNSADFGGGLAVANPYADLQAAGSAFVFSLIDATVSGNTANRNGGALNIYGNVAAQIYNATINGNAAPGSGIGGVRITTGATSPVSAGNATAPTTSVTSSILANSANGAADVGILAGAIASPYTVATNNSLVEARDADTALIGAANILGTDPQLAPLALNGGPTRTHALLAGSPAIDAGSNPLNLVTDQRGTGFPRVVGTAADIGAFESTLSSNHAPVANAGPDQTKSTGQSVQLAGTCTDTDNDTTTPTWSFASKPASSTATLSSATVLNPTFTADVPGSYQLQLVCNDGHVDSTPSLVVITVSGPSVTLTLSSPLVGVGRTINGTITLSQAAPAGGIAVSLTSANPGLASVSPSPVVIAAGGTGGSFSVTGVAIGGPITITGAATGYTNGTTSVTVTNALVSLGTLPTIGLGQSVSLPVSLTAPAPAGGLTITFASSDTSIATITPSVSIAAGQTIPASNPQVTGVNVGSAQITASAAGFAPDARTANVQVNVTFTPTTLGVVQSTSQNITVQSSAPAPAGGLTLALATANTAVATVASPVTIPQGQTSVTAAVTGVAVGSTTLQATGTGVTSGTATINVTAAPLISLGNQTIGKDLQASTSLSLGAPAPAGGVVVTLTSADPSKVLLSSSSTTVGSASLGVTIPAGQSFFNPFYVQALSDSGTVTLTATAPGYATDTSTITLSPSGFYNPNPGADFTTTTSSSNTLFRVQAVVLNATGNLVSTSQSVRGGATVSVPITVTDVTGTNVGSITITPLVFTGGDSFKDSAFHPLSAGTAQITVGVPAGFATPVNALRVRTATVTSATVNISNQTIGKDLQVSSSLSLDGPAPAGGLAVTLTSSDASKLLLSTSSTAAGSASITVTVPAGQTSLFNAFFIQSLADTGTATVSASAPGYATSTATMTLAPSGFYNSSPGGDFTTTTSSANTLFRVQAAVLNAAGNVVNSGQTVRGGATVSVPITVTDVTGTNVGSMTVNPVVFIGGDTLKDSAFHPISAGTAQVAVGVPTGFATPVNSSRIRTVTVTSATVNISNQTIGKDLQASSSLSLDGPAPAGGLVVTLTSSDASKLLLSTSSTAAGSASITVTVPAGQTSLFSAFFIQSLADTGTATVSASAPGYATSTATMTLAPSGFYNSSPGGDFTTTTFSANTLFRVQAAVLNAAGNVVNSGQSVRGGATVSVPLTIVDVTGTNVGSITVNPVVFNGGDSFRDSAFDPISAGTAQITVGVPTGFATPVNSLRVRNVTVTAPSISLGNVTVGRNLQTSAFISLGATPPSPVNVTVTIAAPSIAAVSSSGTTVGGTTVTFTGVTTTSVGSIFIQGLSLGGTSITVQAPGYSDDTSTVTVRPSGFVNSSPGGNFSTTPLSNDTLFRIQPALLDPTTLNVTAFQAVRAGLSVTVPVTSSNPSIGTVAAVTFNGGDSFKDTAFHPLADGSTLLTVDVPAGFDTPSNSRQFTATVSDPTFSIGDQTIGKDLQLQVSMSLGAPAPAGGVTVTLASSDPARILLANTGTAAGASSITVTVPQGQSFGSFFVQALDSTGSATVTASASQFATDTSTMTLVPSGFVNTSPGGNFSTTTGAGNVLFRVQPARLDPFSLNVAAFQAVRGGLAPVAVPVTSSNTAVGVITISPVTFAGGDSFKDTAFDPVTSGTSTLTVGVPPGFSTPSNSRSITATVN